MRLVRPLRCVVLSLACATAVGCGGDKSGITGPKNPPSPNSVHLQSDAGDYIGGGQSYNYNDHKQNIVTTLNELARRCPQHLS